MISIRFILEYDKMRNTLMSLSICIKFRVQRISFVKTFYTTSTSASSLVTVRPNVFDRMGSIFVVEDFLRLCLLVKRLSV